MYSKEQYNLDYIVCVVSGYIKGVTKKTECSRFSYPNHSILNISKPNFQEIIY